MQLRNCKPARKQFTMNFPIVENYLLQNLFHPVVCYLQRVPRSQDLDPGSPGVRHSVHRHHAPVLPHQRIPGIYLHDGSSPG